MKDICGKKSVLGGRRVFIDYPRKSAGAAWPSLALVFISRVASERVNLVDWRTHHPRGLRLENACARSRLLQHFFPLTLLAPTHPPTSVFTTCRVWNSKRSRWNGKSPVSQSRLAHSLLARIVEKAKVVGRGILRGKILLQEHRTLYRTLIGILAEHLDPESRNNRGTGHLDDTGGNVTAAPTYCFSLHRCRTESLTPDPSRGIVGEQGSREDTVLDGKPADR